MAGKRARRVRRVVRLKNGSEIHFTDGVDSRNELRGTSTQFFESEPEACFITKVLRRVIGGGEAV